MKSYAEKIKDQREHIGLTQEQVAGKLKMTRPTYNAIETGKRELTLSELHTLCNTLGLTVEQFLFSSSEPIAYESKMDKFKQLILNCLQYSTTPDSPQVNKSKLSVLVAICDFASYYERGIAISDLHYRHTEQGPIVDAYSRMIDELYDEGAVTIELRGRAIMIARNEPSAPTSLLNDAEIKLIHSICQHWLDATTQSVIEFAKQNTPWHIYTHGEMIPYEPIRDEAINPLIK